MPNISMLINKKSPKNKKSLRFTAYDKSISDFTKFGLAAGVLLVSVLLGSCSENSSDKGKELANITREVLASDQLKEKLSEVLNTTEQSSSVNQSVVIDSTVKRIDAELFKECRQFFAGGNPPVSTEQPLQRALCYDAFAILHSGKTKTPVYVAQRLNKEAVADADEKRTNKFFSDARLPIRERATLDDYRNSGYSRGHMAPAGDMPTAQAMAQSFSLANMVPQNQNHNGGAWAKIEKDTRAYASRAVGDVYVITGPVFTEQSPAIGDGKVAVPQYIFKLVYDSHTKRAWAHWHRNQDDERAGKPISYEELVKRTGIQFLPNLTIKN